MNRTCLILMVLVLPTTLSVAEESPNEAFQRGLLEEEVNHNLPAAIQAYQSALTLFEEQRKIAATATFRLGECYRRQGKTNEALAQFLRVTRDFPDQTALLTLSQKYLTDNRPATGAPNPAQPAPDTEQTKLLREEMELVEKQIRAVQRAFQNGKASSDELIALQRECLGLKRKLPENTPAAQQQSLIEQEIQYVEQLLTERRKRIEVGQAAPADEIPFQRDLLRLRRELLAVQDTAKPQVRTRLNQIVRQADAPGAVTDEESKAIQRIQELIVNSPDLINARDNSGLTPLQDAAGKGQLTVARFLLDNHADVNATTRPQNTEERTALHIASASGHKAMVELLIARGATVNVQDKSGNTPLHEAARNGFQAVVQVLLANGAQINARNQGGDSSLKAAIRGVQRGTAEFLLAHKADINAQDKFGHTPLADAVYTKRLEMVEMLLAHKPDVNLKDTGGTTALTESVAQGTSAITELLLVHGADPNVKGITFNRDSTPATRWAPLHNAASKGDLHLIEALLLHKADINLRDDLGSTPLLVAVLNHNEPAVEMLLGGGADPNIQDNQGNSPLSVSVTVGSQPMIQALLDKGAKVNAPIPGGATALFTAISQGRPELVELLLVNGADPNAKSAEGYTPLHLAAASGKTNLIKILLGKDAEINRQDALGNAPLHYAAYKVATDAVRLLLDRGAKIDIRNDEGQTPVEMIGDARYRQSSRWGIPQRSPIPLPGPLNLGPRRILAPTELEVQRLLQERAASNPPEKESRSSN